MKQYFQEKVPEMDQGKSENTLLHQKDRKERILQRRIHLLYGQKEKFYQYEVEKNRKKEVSLWKRNVWPFFFIK